MPNLVTVAETVGA